MAYSPVTRRATKPQAKSATTLWAAAGLPWGFVARSVEDRFDTLPRSRLAPGQTGSGKLYSIPQSGQYESKIFASASSTVSCDRN